MKRHVWIRLPRETALRVAEYDVSTIGILGRDCAVIATSIRRALGRRVSSIYQPNRRQP